MMKRILPLLLCLALLCGCGSNPGTEAVLPTESTQSVVSEPVGYYDPNSTLEAETGGAIRCYPLGSTDVSGILTVEDTLLLFSSDSDRTELTALSGETLIPIASRILDFSLFPEDACLRPWANGISFYDPVAMETVVVDSQLREVSRISAPAGLMGTPLLSYDRSTLYYCTDTALRALNLETGISRVLKEMSHDFQELSGLLMEESVLACTVSDGNHWQLLYLSTETGAILEQREDMVLANSSADRYYAAIPDGSVISQVFGTAQGQTRCLMPREEAVANYFLPETFGLVSIPMQEDTQTVLDYYDLDSCLRTASVSLPGCPMLWSFRTSADGRVWFLYSEENQPGITLCCWDPVLSPTGDNTFYGGIHYTPEEPDTEGLAQCQAYAQEIGEKYGIEVLVYKDAVRVQPWDYDLEPEHLVGVIQRELELLDRNLARYPEGFISTLAQRFDGLSICIVRSLNGTAESGSLDSADGIQFMDGYRACIALAATMDTEYALFHEMCHLIDTMVLGESSAYDRWDELNPKGFEYDFDYIANQSRDGSAYLQDINRSFIDTYSMSFPKEDRARIMEYAMTEGNESYFQSTIMQSKLKLLCEGIREAFGLKKSPETFLWEQYLTISLAYTK